MMKRTVITGGQGDIAKELANLFVQNNDYISLPGKTDLDVTNESQVRNFFKITPCDILINNAGCIHPKSIVESDTADWKKDIDTNLIGVYLCCKYSLLNNSKVQIINIGSSAAYKGKKEWSSYCASKAGVMSLTESLIMEGVNAYCLNIGRAATKMRYFLFGEEDINTLLSPKEIAIEVLDIVNNKRESNRIYRLQKV